MTNVQLHGKCIHRFGGEHSDSATSQESSVNSMQCAHAHYDYFTTAIDDLFLLSYGDQGLMGHTHTHTYMSEVLELVYDRMKCCCCIAHDLFH